MKQLNKGSLTKKKILPIFLARHLVEQAPSRVNVRWERGGLQTAIAAATDGSEGCARRCGGGYTVFLGSGGWLSRESAAESEERGGGVGNGRLAAEWSPPF
jgi:hypothetical protein